jgi:hypothetical protein
LSEAKVKITTYHPSDFNLLDPLLKIDPSRGQYWEEDEQFRYRSILPKLHAILGSDQIVWCVFNRDDYILTERHVREYVEWEYVGSIVTAVRYLNSRVWEDIVWSRGDEWDTLIVAECPADITRVKPIVLNDLAKPEWWACHGPLSTLDVRLPK